MRSNKFKRSKYNACPTFAVEDQNGSVYLVAEKDATPDEKRLGIRFHSWGEADRYTTLLMMQKAGEISLLQRQPPFECRVNGVLVTTYIADFRYYKDGALVVEDVKGKATETYELKKKLVEAIYNVYVKEIRPRRKPSAKVKSKGKAEPEVQG